MQVTRHLWAGTFATALLIAGTAHAAIFPVFPDTTPGFGPLVNGSSYAEVGDAGNVFDPQDVAGTGINQITGDIGSGLNPTFLPGALSSLGGIAPANALPLGADTQDAFRFYFAGGPIEFIGTVDVTFVVCPFLTEICELAGTIGTGLPLSLFTEANPNAPLTPSGVSFWDIRFPNLAAGNYIIQGTYELVDPPFTIDIINPTTGSPQTVGAPIPEPATLALLGLGLAGLAAARRRKAD